MGMLRTLTLSATVGQMLLLTPAPLRAMEDPARLFAICTGRLSAVMEQSWLDGGPAADMAGLRRAAMLSLLEAVADPLDSDLLALRVQAKAVQADLLARARFAQDPVAALTADRLEGECLALMPGQT